MNVKNLMAELERRHPGENEYLQAVREVLTTVEEAYNQHPEFEANRIAERIVEPDRQFTFKVVWVECGRTFHLLFVGDEREFLLVWGKYFIEKCGICFVGRGACCDQCNGLFRAGKGRQRRRAVGVDRRLVRDGHFYL